MIDDTDNGGEEHLAPVTPLFGRWADGPAPLRSGSMDGVRNGTTRQTRAEEPASSGDGVEAARGASRTERDGSAGSTSEVAAPRRVRFTTVEESAAEGAVRSPRRGRPGEPRSARHRTGSVDRYDAEGWWIDPDADPAPPGSESDARSGDDLGADQERRTGAPTTPARVPSRAGSADSSRSTGEAGRPRFVGDTNASSTDDGAGMAPHAGDAVDADPGAHDSTPTLMRASDLLKPDGERPRRPVALPTRRGWDDARTADAPSADSGSLENDAVAQDSGRRLSGGDDASVPVEANDSSRLGRVASHPSSASGAGAARADRPTRAPRLRLLEDSEANSSQDSAPEDPQAQYARGEAALLKKLRGRGLSVREARAFVIGLEVAAEIADDLIDEFLSRRYLDDAVLAEQLIYTATSRKGQGRRVIAQSLSARGIPREVIDAALEEVPDDDDERALEFARSKARSLAKLEPEVALRRLLGQLARRGFGGSNAMRAAKTALSEAGGSSVRFR